MKTHKKLRLSIASILSCGVLAGCASVPRAPVEAPISIKLTGPSEDVQQFIEEGMGRIGPRVFSVDSATNRSITFKAHCRQIPDVKPLQCGLIMMAVGNSRFDGPYMMMRFTTSEVAGVVNVSLVNEWCAINVYGKSNCMPADEIAEANRFLRLIKESYSR